MDVLHSNTYLTLNKKFMFIRFLDKIMTLAAIKLKIFVIKD